MTEQDFGLAELRSEQERSTAIASARARLRRLGEDNCVACGDPIDVAGRMALPSARRCVDCQIKHEKDKHRR